MNLWIASVVKYLTSLIKEWFAAWRTRKFETMLQEQKEIANEKAEQAKSDYRSFMEHYDEWIEQESSRLDGVRQTTETVRGSGQETTRSNSGTGNRKRNKRASFRRKRRRAARNKRRG